MNDEDIPGLSDSARNVLDLARDVDDPTAPDRARVRRKVFAAAAAGAAAGVVGGAAASASAPPAAAATGAASTAAVAGSTAGAASLGAAGIATSGAVLGKAALAVALVVGSVTAVVSEPWSDPAEGEVAHETTASSMPAPSSADAPAHGTTQPETQPAVLASGTAVLASGTAVLASGTAAIEATEVAPSTPVVEELEPPARARTAEPTEPAEPTAEPGTVEDSLAEEVALLQRARAQLAAGDADSALATLHRHRALYPTGTLAAERDGTLALTLCAHPDRDGHPAARAFLTAHPRSPLSPRIRACLE